MSVNILRPSSRILTLGDMDTMQIFGIGQGAANGLLNNLIAYWPGDEASGNLLDAHTNGLDLTDVNTVTSNPGHVYTTARQYTTANDEYHTRPGDDALLSTGDVDFTIMVWVYADAFGADRAILGKNRIWEPPGRGYTVYYHNSTNKWAFTVSDGANAYVLDSTAAPSLSTWYLLIAWHDSVANTINIQVNDFAAVTFAWSTGVNDPTCSFMIGNADGFGPGFMWDGRIGPTAFWKSAAGDGGVLTAAQRTALWNGGAGLKYSEFTS